MHLEPNRRQVLRPCRHLERRRNPRAGANWHHRADILPLAELALYRRTRAEAKARLSPIAWNQPAITEAAVTFIVCGQLADSSVVPERLAAVVEAGIMPAKLIPDWEIPARGLYADYPQRQRDEAVRTGTFGAAAMIYAARSLGLGSTPMIGFDADAVAREFGLAEDEVPVMLLSVGAERPGNWPQKPRRPVADVLEFA
jgi:nitroreductase